MISLPQPGAVVDAMGVDPESLRAERDRVGRKLRLAKYAGLGAFGLLFLLQLSGVFGVFDVRSILPVFLGGVITLVVLGGLGWWFLRRATKPLTERLDTELVGPLLRTYAAEVDRLNDTTGGHLELGRADEGLLRAAEVVDTGDDVRADDAVEGVLAGEPLRIGEYKVTETRGSDDNRRTVTLFHGTVAEVRTARPISSTLRIVPRSKEEFSGAGLFSGGGVPMENPAMNKAFKVFTDTPQEAYFVLPQTVQEQLVAVAAEHDGGLGLRAEGDRLLVALHRDDGVFDVSLTSTRPLRECLEAIVGQLNDTVHTASLLGAWGGRMERPAALR
ncbi:DUF3137 domain-containing protein [Kytococcus sedentarius]|uniref:DUF3137 domain-containing protein n=1 Tax=Kytococcus sedentarius TaxID=1276 RepID=UPI00384CE140